jgi:hypothetical protein
MTATGAAVSAGVTFLGLPLGLRCGSSLDSYSGCCASLDAQAAAGGACRLAKAAAAGAAAGGI